MCGIFGFGGFDEPGLGARMNAALHHRGPDSGGEWRSPDGLVTLGNRRLQIIDLTEAGRMPMTNEDGNLWITYNGEVYNARELRAELSGRHRFRSLTDTEVLLHAYEEWGDEFVTRLRGMFAFAIWDRRRRRLLLARDRFAQKPLYYWQSGGCLAFASEIRALLCSERIARAPDWTALRDYVCYRYVQGARTGFAGIATLPAGHTAVWTGGELRLRRYWELPAAEASNRRDGWVETTREVIEESVSRRLISDVPVGMMLSGGLDSSLILAMACRHDGVHLHSFTAAFEEDAALDEARKAARTARVLEAKHEIIRVPPPSAEDLDALAGIVEEPLADASCWPTLLIARRARASGITVLLSGEGADELFWGYPRYRALAFSERHPWLRQAGTRAVLRAVGRPQLAIYFSRALLARRNYLAGGGLEADELRRCYPGLAAEAGGEPEDRMALPGNGSVTARAAAWDLRHWLARDILTRVDKTTMAASIEGRAPLVDRKVAELAARLPDGYKCRNGQDKPLLRRVAAAYLPDAIRDTPKTAFRPPLRHWLRQAAGERLRELSESSGLVRQGMVSRTAAREMARDALAGTAAPQRAWTMLGLLTWYERWLA